MTEQELWQLFRNGDKDAFGEIFSSNYKALYQYGRKLNMNPLLLDDSIQDLFLDLWQRKSNLPEIQSVKGYLFKSLKFKLLKSTRNAIKLEEIDPESISYAEFSHESMLIEEQQQKEEDQKLLQGINYLPPRQQEALFLKYRSQLEYEEISEMMGISRQAVINLIYKSVKFLREYLHTHSVILFMLFDCQLLAQMTVNNL